MEIPIKVSAQKMRLPSNYKFIAPRSQKFVKFIFDLSDDWSGMTIFAQFGQNGEAYNIYLDKNNCVDLPPEIQSGKCTLMLYGTGEGSVIATSSFLELTITKDIFVSDANSTAITQSLYQQLVDKVNSFAGMDEEAISAVVEKTAKEVLEAYLADGSLAQMTIGDGTITKNKLGSDVTPSLELADSAMQPSVYDPQGLKADIFAYSKARADTVQNNLDKVESNTNSYIKGVKDEISDARVVNATAYDSMGDAIRAVLSLANNYTESYTKGALGEYEAFYITIVNELPSVGVERTFYLVPNSTGTKYDKYWWIVDKDGNYGWDVFGASSTVVVTELPEKGDVDTDYILKIDSGCIYYKWIDNQWALVAGSMSEVVESLPKTGNSFTDYYIQTESGTYIHYRWMPTGEKDDSGEDVYDFIPVGSDSYSKAELDAMLNPITNTISEQGQKIDSNTTNINSLSNSLTKLQQDVSEIDTEGYTYYATLTQDDNGNYIYSLYEVKDDLEELKSQFMLPAGGGGGTSSTTNLVVEKITESPLVITTTDSAVLEIMYSSTDSDGSDVDGTYVLKQGGTQIMTGALAQGLNSFDVTQYCAVGTQKFTLTVTDDGGSVAVKSWTVQVVDVRITSTFSDRYTNAIGRTVSFTYTPYGSISKTVHFKLDGVEIDTITTAASGTLQSYTIQPQDHGSHLLEVWITATINHKEIETEHIFKDIIWYDESLTDAVIGCIYRNDCYGTVVAKQYNTTAITYNVYDPTTNSPKVTLSVDGDEVSSNVLTSNQNVWNYKTDEIGLHTLTITCRDTTVTIIINITELGIDVSPITGNLEMDFNPSGITNSSANRLWSNGTVSMTVSDNFDWANGGYQTDSDGNDYFCVKAGTRAVFDYAMFGGGLTSNPSIIGSEMKIIFMTEHVQDANATWLTNVETTTSTVNGVNETVDMGIQMNVHEGWLKTNNALSSGETSTGVAATNTYLYMPYSEEDIIEMDINIDAINRDTSGSNAFVMAYEDGVPSKAFVYDSTDRFYQYTPQPITIGSDECDVRIYRLKCYSTSLTSENVMRNFIADAPDSDTMLGRYNRNCIYYNSETGEYTPYSSEGALTPEGLAKACPDLKILKLDCPTFTKNKKTFIKNSTLECIHVNGDPILDNWKFINGYHSGQGTTSDNYGPAGRNIDFLFNADGIHKVSDKVALDPAYVSQLTLGYNTENAITYTTKDGNDINDDARITLTRTSFPNNYFNFKVNIASSENANNALLQKRYNDYLPYVSPAKLRDSRLKNNMEFIPAVLFIRENSETDEHMEFSDTNWHFYAIGNIGDSKKTDYTRAYDPDDMNEFTIEISDNTKNNAIFQSGVYLDESGNRVIESVDDTTSHSFIYPITSEEWNSNNKRYYTLYNEGFDGDHSFEPRYACCGDYRDGKLVNDTHDGKDPEQLIKNEGVWRAFYRWVITATDEQFVSELPEWCVESAVEFFYCYTHNWTMMDNRAKNTFWHFAKTGKYREVSRPVAELLHVYCERTENIVTNSDGTTTPEYTYFTTTDTSIQSGKTYYTQYAFDLSDYDNDTALGINNNGELIFPYGKEDSDYNTDGVASSGYVFNGAESTFWCRLRDLKSAEITKVYNGVSSKCWSAEDLITEFDEWQSSYPEEVWRLDIERKCIRTFTGNIVDNSISKKDISYLRDMMQGRKKYQRRQWTRDQEIYFATRELNPSVTGSNYILFRCNTPVGDDVVIKPDYTLHITPYSDMYISVMFGNGGTSRVRAKGGTEYTIECPLASMDDTQVVIYGASRIAALNDISACYIHANNFSMATKLRKLVIGNAAEGYNNSFLTTLNLGNNALLEELDIRNCGSLSGSLDLTGSVNLLRLYAEGSAITGVTFATNGKVQTIHLPDTINTLIMRNLNDLTDFKASLNRLETLTLQGGTLNSLDVITDTIDTLQVLNLYDIDWVLGSTDILNALLGLFYSVVTGKAYVSGQIRNQELLRYAAAWTDLEVTYDPANMVTQYLVTYKNADGSVLYTTYVDRGSTPPDPYALGYIDKPTLQSTAQYVFDYSGWDNLSSVVLEPMTITAQYNKTVRTYKVEWFLRAGVSLGAVDNVEYGSEVIYDGDIPTNTSEENTYIYNVFVGWDKSTGYITGNTDVYAIWDRKSLDTTKNLKDMSPAEIYAVCESGNAATCFADKDYIDIDVGHDFQFTNVESRLLAEELYLDGNTYHDTGIKLFDESAPSFTLAIDYEFTDNIATNATLVSCYEDDGTEGFRLRYNSNPNIQWGNTNLSVGYQNQRNIIALRHIKGSNILYVYSNNGDVSSNVYSNNIIYSALSRNRDTVSNATLGFGAVKFLSDGGCDFYGTGFIHWAKIWFDDLGNANARELVAWTHENWRFEYCGTGRYRIAGGTSQRARASFICNHLLRYVHVMNPTGTNAGGWDQSNMRDFCNNKLYNAFPIAWRALMKTVRISATKGSTSSEMIVSEDKVYLAALGEVQTRSETAYAEEAGSLGKIPWFVAQGSISENATRIKFLGRKLREDVQYFTSSSDPTLVNSCNYGDVWINTDNSSIGYILVSQDELAKYNITPYAIASTGGGWVSAIYWWLRSPYLGGSASFWNVYYYGSLTNGNANGTFGICPCFSI